MQNLPIVLEIKEAVARLLEIRLASPLNWTIREGEQWAICGPNGAGKTLVSNILLGKTALSLGNVFMKSGAKVSDFVKGLSFKDIYSIVDCSEAYYQQRWQSTEVEEQPSVADVLKSTQCVEDDWNNLAARFGIKDFFDKKLISLSSGELRKFQIVKTLMAHPKILLLDNPYIGLDVDSRNTLTLFLQQLLDTNQIQLVLLIPDPNEIPAFITHILPIKNRQCYSPIKASDFCQSFLQIKQLFDISKYTSKGKEGYLPVSPFKYPSRHKVTFKMEKVSIRYGNRVIIKDLDWKVMNGEKWSLSGANGSGKSTLLSLIYADNPQSYSNTLYLFDKKRGTGESIWDIKKRIGYISPEMHMYYKENVSSLRIVASGFFDSIGLYRKCTVEQKEKAMAWMRVFSIESLRDRSFLSLSNGEQRMVLLARSFVKEPDLLILDEPLHGLDIANKSLAMAVINTYCSLPGKTMIYVTHYDTEIPECVDHYFKLDINR